MGQNYNDINKLFTLRYESEYKSGSDTYAKYYANLTTGSVDFVFKNGKCVIVASTLEDMLVRLKNKTASYSSLKKAYGDSIDRHQGYTYYESIFKIGDVNFIIEYEKDDGTHLDNDDYCAIYTLNQTDFDNSFWNLYL